jgi:hypothetical protein
MYWDGHQLGRELALNAVVLDGAGKWAELGPVSDHGLNWASDELVLGYDYVDFVWAGICCE